MFTTRRTIYQEGIHGALTSMSSAYLWLGVLAQCQDCHTYMYMLLSELRTVVIDVN